MKNSLFIVMPLVAVLILTSGCGTTRTVSNSTPVEIASEEVDEVATEVIGSQMDQQIADLEKIEGVQVEAVSGYNNLKVIKVTIAEGILFPTNSSELNQSSRDALTSFARSLVNHPQTTVSIHGHTDNTGTRAINERLSDERAKSVAGFLSEQGVLSHRMAMQGFASDSPVADNSSDEGRAKNRRVEIFISADETMIQQARATAETRIGKQASSTPTSATGYTNFNKGDHIIGIGAGLPGNLYSGYHYYSGYRRWPTLSLYYEHCIIDNLFDAKSAIGVGGMVGYATARWKNSSTGWHSDNIFFGARAAFHYAFLPKLDAYAGFMAGYSINSWKWTGDYGVYESHIYGSNGFVWSGFAGARYYFTNNIAVFGEVGYGMSIFNGGISFKF